jgi:hypothetical protein
LIAKFLTLPPHKSDLILVSTPAAIISAPVVEGAKHKSKATEKEEARAAKAEIDAISTKSAKDKKDKKRQPLKDENGNDLKRPLSAYMLYNNYRRPVLRAEHSGRSLLLNPSLTQTFRAHPDRLVEADW